MKSVFKIVLPVILCFLFGACNRTQKGESVFPEKIDYNFHIRPILSDRCFKCHGPDEEAREARLRLDIPEGAFGQLPESPGKFAVVPHKADQSEIIHRIFSTDSALMMPPPESLLKLSEYEKTLIRRWIEQGAEFKPHWAFIAPAAEDKPENITRYNKKNPIDFYIQNKLREVGLKPSPPAGASALVKRLSLDLTGLLPPDDLVAWFEKDPGDERFKALVDTLLDSPHYGEQMAVSWLDVARYADSHGYQDDGLRTMWPWRDWVIHAFNQNYSYKQMVTWQLAGDLLAARDPEHPKEKEMLLATGFNRNHKITQEGGVIDEEYRIEYVTDRTNTFGKAFLGLTFECAKCHDHKYDPISQKDYFSTFAFFNQVPEKGIFGTIDASFADPPNMEISNSDVQDILQFINKKDSGDLKVMVMADAEKARPTFVLNRGAYDLPGEEVSFGLPSAILPFDPALYPPNRLGLAEWLFEDQHPLTARVFVNRLWAHFFGRGLVATTGDFGMQGELPTHPELLDWLAMDLKDNDWDIKELIRKIVTSSTYRQSSAVTPEHLEKDPDNIYYARASRMRLTAENIRDMVLSSSGLLNPEIGGPSVKPYQPEGIWESATSGRGSLARYVQDEGNDLYRRGLYTFIKRTVPPPSMLIFDASNRDQCEVQRIRTNTPLQALVMLNDPLVTECAKFLAREIIKEETNPKEQIRKGFRKILCRYPTEKELEILTDYYEEQKVYYFANGEQINELKKVGVFNPPAGEINEGWASLTEVMHMIYNLEEAITRS